MQSEHFFKLKRSFIVLHTLDVREGSIKIGLLIHELFRLMKMMPNCYLNLDMFIVHLQLSSCLLCSVIIVCFPFTTIVAGNVFETRTNVVHALPVHSNGVINYVIVVCLFRTALRDRLKNFCRNNKVNRIEPVMIRSSITKMFSYSILK